MLNNNTNLDFIYLELYMAYSCKHEIMTLMLYIYA